MRKPLVYMVSTALLAAVLAVVVFAPGRSGSKHDGKVAVTATFYPMAEFSRQVGGALVHVKTLVQPGMEPHDYDPTAKDIAALHSAALFVYNGAGLERWAGKLQPELAASHVVTVEASRGIPLRGKDASDTENTAATDPHVWMDPGLAITEVSNIRDGLIKADPAHKTAYQANAAAYIAKLQQLDQQFRAGLSTCAQRTIITSHQAFGYLAARYGLTAVGITGLSPDNEPSPQKLAEVTALAASRHIDYIFFETLVSPALAQTIARETGAHTIAFNPLEGLTEPETKAGKDYISVQQNNLQSLRTALHCN